jgi:hypothetical protein
LAIDPEEEDIVDSSTQELEVPKTKEIVNKTEKKVKILKKRRIT